MLVLYLPILIAGLNLQTVSTICPARHSTSNLENNLQILSSYFNDDSKAAVASYKKLPTHENFEDIQPLKLVGAVGNQQGGRNVNDGGHDESVGQINKILKIDGETRRGTGSEMISNNDTSSVF